jgi:hypothetical protein
MDGLTYFGRAVSYIPKMFMNLTTGVNAIKLFSSSLKNRQNKLERLSLLSLFSLV